MSCHVMSCFEIDFVAFWVNFDQNTAKEGRPKFDKLEVRWLILTVKLIRKYLKY